MRHRYPLPLHHSWPLFERAGHFDLGWVDRTSVRLPDRGARPCIAEDADTLARLGAGVWHCDLADNRLSWTDAIYDLFDLPRGSDVARAEAVAHYCEASRAAMERLRAHGIAHRRGFTLDVEIGPARARTRWIRLIAAPVCDGDRVVALHGIKLPLPDQA